MSRIAEIRDACEAAISTELRKHGWKYSMLGCMWTWQRTYLTNTLIALSADEAVRWQLCIENGHIYDRSV